LRRFTIFVPRGPELAGRTLIAGSGLVGIPAGPGRVLVYFEGNRYGSENVRTWADKVRVAAGRLQEVAPTSAVLIADANDLYAVGSIGYGLDDIDVVDRSAVQLWIGRSDLVRELEFSS
jgi:hypothetical protein